MARNLGLIYKLSGTGITTTYQAGGNKGAGNGVAPKRHFPFLAQLLASGSNITGVTIKAQGSVDGTSWFDLTSTNDLTGTAAVDQTFSTIDATNHTVSGSISVNDIWYFLRVQAKATGGAGQAGESISIYALDAPA